MDRWFGDGRWGDGDTEQDGGDSEQSIDGQ